MNKFNDELNNWQVKFEAEHGRTPNESELDEVSQKIKKQIELDELKRQMNVKNSGNKQSPQKHHKTWVWGVVIVVIFALVGVAAFKIGSSSSNETSGQDSSSVTSTSSQNDKEKNNTSSAESKSSAASSSSSSSSVVPVDDNTVGVMVSLLAMPDWFKGAISDPGLYYGVNNAADAGEVQGYNYITGNGDGTGQIFYKINGNTVTYKHEVVGENESVATGHLVTATATLSRLEHDYYSTSAQKAEVKNYVSQLQSEDAFNAQYDSTMDSAEAESNS